MCGKIFHCSMYGGHQYCRSIGRISPAGPASRGAAAGSDPQHTAEYRSRTGGTGTADSASDEYLSDGQAVFSDEMDEYISAISQCGLSFVFAVLGGRAWDNLKVRPCCI